MNMSRIAQQFENGFVKSPTSDVKTSSLAWNEHQVFNGVYLRHLVKGEASEGRISCHLVRVKPYGILDTHVHEGKLEIHQVLEGEGTAQVGSQAIIYQPGSVAVIPDNTEHRVAAGSEGLLILAAFSPALL